MSFHSSAPANTQNATPLDKTKRRDTFDVFALRIRYSPNTPYPLTINMLRGAFGSALKSISETAYQHYFAPVSTVVRGDSPEAPSPSGLRDLPRPFVFRLITPDVIGLNIFSTDDHIVDLFTRAMHGIEMVSILEVTREVLRLPLDVPPTAALLTNKCLRVHYLTPTELKGCNETPSFEILISRIRDRISTLRAMWGGGPIDLDFKAFTSPAVNVRTTHSDLIGVRQMRLSRARKQRHSIGGVTGVIEYEFPSADTLAPYIPYLEIARWTGVGRQTVWGKGEISFETF